MAGDVVSGTCGSPLRALLRGRTLLELCAVRTTFALTDDRGIAETNRTASEPAGACERQRNHPRTAGRPGSYTSQGGHSMTHAAEPRTKVSRSPAAPKETRPQRTLRAKERDPRPEQRGNRGPRPGAPKRDDLQSLQEYGVGIAIDII